MKNSLLVIFLLISTIVLSQNSHLGLNMGAAFPLKNYAGFENYTSSGYAQPGFTLTFDANYIPTWYFGIGAAFVFTTNYPNQDSMLTGLANELRASDEFPVIPDDAEIQYTIGQWSCVNLMVGPTFAYPVGRFQFNIKALLGVSVVMPPSETMSLTFVDETQISGYSDIQDVKFCYDFGTDIIFELSSSYSIKLSADYFHTRTDYSMNIGYEDLQLAPVQRDIKIDALHTTLGFAYLF